MILQNQYETYERLKPYEKYELSTIAKENNINIYGKSGKIDKGWKGKLIETMGGIKNNCNNCKDGLDFELKTTSYIEKNKDFWIPKETIAITYVNKDKLINTDFSNSILWEKIKNILCCIVSYDGKNSITSTLLYVCLLNFEKEQKIFNILQDDYELFRNKIKNKLELKSIDGTYIQTRTKGKKQSNTRAFYFRKKFLNEFFPCGYF